ncbi:uncharacterized protein IL334_000825 [Kwoniella shivajii]|uniref:MARVEL domain-containing protein n=1 Tax=Kwoniella shivajii TaxID=564305 RepID=A0ABZ1CRB2_9TREE|nr:hypothetical protein IL334_000825 [Kwoniella shivajii]
MSRMSIQQHEHVHSNPYSSFTPILLSLTILSIYLLSGSLYTNRSSPPISFTISSGLILASYKPGLITALISITSIIIGNTFLAIDYIHGECWYEVLVGGQSWHKDRLGELAWYKQCVQPSQAWWLIIIVGLIWSLIAIVCQIDFTHKPVPIYTQCIVQSD